MFTTTVSQGIGALNTLWQLGLRVPEDISVIAHADMPLSEYLVPPLTAVKMPLAELGVAGVDALLTQIETGATTEIVIDDLPELVVRGSTAPPRDGALITRPRTC